MYSHKVTKYKTRTKRRSRSQIVIIYSKYLIKTNNIFIAMLIWVLIVLVNIFTTLSP